MARTNVKGKGEEIGKMGNCWDGKPKESITKAFKNEPLLHCAKV